MRDFSSILRKCVAAMPVAAILWGCVEGLPDGAGAGTWDLYRTLAYYRYVERDTLKYAAARYLIENMRYHHSGARICRENDTLARWMGETDSIYYSFVRGRRMEDFP